MSDDDYEKKVYRSLTLSDLRQVERTLEKLTDIRDSIGTGSVIAWESQSGVVLGECWWNGIAENWVVDFERAGSPDA